MGLFRFRNPHVKKIPPQREHHHVEHIGVSSKGFEYHLKLDSVEIEQLRLYLIHPMDAPPLLGNWELMNDWISNMWEALYNPIWLWLKPSGGFSVIHGHHRFRLLNKMDAKKIWFYGLKMKHDKVGNLFIPIETKRLIRRNDRAPRRGTVAGICKSCGRRTKWAKKKIDRITDIRMYCKLCGAENPYPWNGQI